MLNQTSTTAIARTLLLAGILLAVTVLAARSFFPAFCSGERTKFSTKRTVLTRWQNLPRQTRKWKTLYGRSTASYAMSSLSMRPREFLHLRMALLTTRTLL